MFNFSEKSALITGAAGGIGMATAEYFYSCGANIVLADINQSAVKSLVEKLDPHGKRTAFLRYDAGNPEDADAAVKLSTDRFGKIDYVVVGAGIYEDQIANEMSDDQWRRMMAINLDGVFYIIRRAIPAMAEDGAIVTVASIAAHQGGSYQHAHYGAAKGGVLAYTRGLARDLAPRIRVNSVSPGTIDTPMVARMVERGGDQFKSAIPMRRLGKPSEIASVIAFLCSDAASYVTGETIIAAGGSYMA